jgi:hypothetical protein
VPLRTALFLDLSNQREHAVPPGAAKEIHALESRQSLA